MPRFEVFCPAAPPAVPADVTLQVDADSWFAALGAGLRRLGAGRPASHILCDVQADGSIHVAEPQGGGVFRIRELRDAAPAARPAAPPAPRVSPPSPPPATSAPGAHAAEVAALGRQAGLERLLDLALEKLEADAGSVLLTRPNGQDLEFVAVRGPRAKELEALRATVRVGVGIVGYCVREGVCLAVSDARKDPRFLRAISVAIGYETRAIVCAPIARKGGPVLGAFELLNRRGGASFGAEDVRALSELAAAAAEHLARHAG